MMPVCSRVILIIASLWLNCTFAEDWKPFDTNDASVELWVSAQHPGQPYDVVRGEISVQVPILPLLAMLQDAGRQRDWLPFTQDVRIIERPAPKQTLVQFRTVTRWPFRPRDAITRFDVTPTPPAQLRIDMINSPLAIPDEPGYLRIQQAEGYWLLTALPDCKTQVRYESGSRWGGMIPQWLVNKSNRELAQEALLNLKQWTETHYREYKDHDENYSSITVHQHCQ